MSGAPQILPPSQDAGLKEAARAFLDAMETNAIAFYGVEAASELAAGPRTAMLLSIALQSLVTPEALRATSVDMDYAAKGIGMALGAQCGACGFSEAQMAQVLQWFHGGFLRGHEDNRRAVSAMTTQGGTQ